MKKTSTHLPWRLGLVVTRSGGLHLCALLIILLNFTPLAQAQKIIWDKTIGGSDNDILAVVQQTADGGYILGGTSNSGKSGDKTQDSLAGFYGRDFQGDYWIVKLKPDGTKDWDKTYGGGGQDKLAAVIQTRDGGYILAGTSNSYKSGDKSQDNYKSEYGFGSDYWIVRIKGDGSKLWDKTIGGTEDEELVSIQQTQDGGFILGGTSSSGISGDKTQASKGNSDYWIVKLNADGSKAWDKTLGGKDVDYLGAVQQTSDGGYILGGYSESGKTGDKSEARQGYTDYWIIKLNADGNKVWDKTLGANKDDQLHALQQTSDGGYIVGGSTYSGKSGDKSEVSRGGEDFWIIKLSVNGNKVWDKTIGGNNSEKISSVQQTPDGGYLVGGTSYSGKGGDKTEDRLGYWIVKIDNAGTKTWDRVISSQGGDNLSSVILTADGNYLLGGTSYSRISGDKSEDNRDKLFYNRATSDFWVVKVDNQIRKNQNLIFPEIPTKTTTDAPFTLSAKTSANLPVTFTIISGPAVVKGNKLTLTGAGNVIIKATQAGNATYNPVVTTRTFTVLLASQQQDFTYGGNRADTLTTMLVTPEGGYLLAGTSASGISGDKTQASQDTTDFWLVKTDATSKKLWDKNFGGNGVDKPTVLVATPDGGYLLGGSSTSGISGQKSQANKGKSDYWIIKLDAQGEKQWDKTYGGNAQDQLTAILITPEGYLLGGTSNSGISGDKTQDSIGETDFWVIKTDLQGKVLWDKTYGGNKADVLVSMLATPNGYLLGGTSASGTSGDKSQINRTLADYWIILINKQGIKQWDKTYGGLVVVDDYEGYTYSNVSSELQSIVPTPDGGFLLGGNSNAAKGGEKSVERPPIYSNYSRILTPDFWVIKIDAQGKKLWDKIYGGVMGTLEVGFDPTYDVNIGVSSLSKIVPLPEGGYLLAGTSNAKAGAEKSESFQRNSEIIYSTTEVNDYWILKIDEQGNTLGDKTIGGYNNDKLTTAVLAPSGDYVLGGTSFSDIGADKSATNQGIADFWLVQVKDGSRPAPAAWNLRYGGNGRDHLTSTIKTRDGGYLSAGYTNSGVSGDKTQNSQGKNDYWIVKSDAAGNKLWDKRYGGSGDDYLNRVIQTRDGGYLLAGSSVSGKSSDKTEASKGKRDYWLVKVDAQGTTEWDKTLGGSGYDELKKVVELASGEYVLGGYSNSPVSGDKTQPNQGGTDYWLVKLAHNGTKLWDKTYGGTQDEILGSFTETTDGGFLLAGSSSSAMSGDKSQASKGASDYWIVKTDPTGSLVWEKTYGGSGQDEAYSVATSGTEFFIAGTSSSGKSGDKSQESKGGKDYWLIKLDQKGNKLWDRTYGGDQDDELRASSASINGGLVLAGFSYSNNSGNKSQNSQGESDYWIVQVDAEGNPIQDQRYGGSGKDELRTVTHTPDGGLLLAGRSNSDASGDRSQPSQGSTDYWLVKIAAPASSIVATRTVSLTEEPGAELTTVTAYPNPFQEKVTVSFTLPQTQIATLRILDSQGKAVATLFQQEAQAQQPYEVEWQASKQEAGMYFLQLQTPTDQSTRKLLLSK
ncbi:T9SS type A sorting domain-containing protein [Adhaeribacter swui]|uniref:T9SS type A sorting domain-containing protein n=1 Tax=Adhaeribacter swui TaxID=2086471 RepID=A0A7G7G4P9_9BACT|nr:T9SS type A sorting domain-containing protein [Adhaeribacter swui]QNF32133.1 T9SS type A sorting domain-containing protein [Adhaeribacter swui]